MVLDVHERLLRVPVQGAEPLLRGLATAEDALWPADRWPAMRAEAMLAPGVTCRHGPVRYAVETLDAGRTVVFRFLGPKGFHGRHGFTLTPAGEAACRLRHTLVLKPTGRARFSWPLFYRPLHDALVEDALDRAERYVGTAPEQPARHGAYVRALRRLVGL